jgi:uncharacterized protein
MKINDRIYGEIVIQDQVIIDIIDTPLFQRLKNISQDGAPHFIQPVRNVSRYEHSIGVWYLSKLYNRSVEEQIACLLHDLSHTAFSHVVDFVFKNKKHEYADTKLNDMILQSEIPQIIEKYGYKIEKVLDKSKFPLLDNNLPDISFDRWDYFMRDGYAVGFLPLDVINLFLQGIKEKDDVLYFSDLRLASTFAIFFVNFSRLIWLDPTSHGSFFLLAEAIKLALEDNEIAESDLFTDDNILLAKLKNSKNIKIINLLDRLQPGKEFVYADEANAEFFGPNKPRFVDPLVQINNEKQRVSSLVPSISYYFDEFAKNYKFLGVRQDIL